MSSRRRISPILIPIPALESGINWHVKEFLFFLDYKTSKLNIPFSIVCQIEYLSLE